MSFELVKAARDLSHPDLSPSTRHLVLLLATYANADGHTWPSVLTLARQSGLARSTVQKSLADLRSRGWLSSLHDARGPVPATYKLTLPARSPGTASLTGTASQAGSRGPIDDTGLPDTRTLPARPSGTNRSECTEAPIASARATPPGASLAQDQSPGNGTLSRADRLAMLPPDIARQLRSPSPPPGDSRSAALAEIERRRSQARSLLASTSDQVTNIDNRHAPPSTVTISASSPADERSFSADERSPGGQ